MANLTTLAAVKAYLTGSVPLMNDDDGLIQSLIASVSKSFEDQTERVIVNASITDTFNGTGRTWKYLENYPIASVTDPNGVMVDGVAIPKRTTGDGWVLTDSASGKLELVGYTWTEGIANCSVTYTAGVGAAAPADIDQAVVDQVAFLYKSKERIGITNQTTPGGVSQTFSGGWKAQTGEDGQTPLFTATVARYRRVG